MNSVEMESRIKELEKRVTKLDDIEDLQRLQKSYGYYIQHWMYEELSDLFVDSPEAELNLLTGHYIGKDSLKNYFYSLKFQNEDPEFLHQLMQLSGIVDVAPDGLTAHGRWYALGSLSLHCSDGMKPLSCNGIYTSDYLKQDGIWKILKLTWHPLYMFPPSESWVKKERRSTTGIVQFSGRAAKPQKFRDVDPRYPFGYIVPFHFAHPVSKKNVDVEKHNAALKTQEKKP